MTWTFRNRKREETAIPYYCYTTADGKTVERNFPMGSVQPTVMVDGKIAYRDHRAENVHGVVKGSKTPIRVKGSRKGWPMEPCVASGVHPSQAGELRDYLAKHDVPTEVTANGDPIYRSAKHRKKALKVRGMHDRNSFT